MSAGEYKPRAGSVAHRVLEHLRAQPAGTKLTAADVEQMFDCTADGVATRLRAAVVAGVLTTTPHGRSFSWSLAPEPDGRLHMAFYSADQDLSVRGMQIDGETAVFTRDELQQLVDFVTRPHIRPSSND